MRKGIRKNAHKIFMKELKNFNKSIQQDILFLGRFEAALVRECWEQYDIDSGCLVCTIRFYDKATNEYLDWIPISYIYWSEDTDNILKFHLFKAYNDFIVRYSSFWKENPRDTYNYNNKKINWNYISKLPLSYNIMQKIE